jgi:hypothetical protein
MVNLSRTASPRFSFLKILSIIKYPNKKDDANNSPYHLTAKEPIRNISGFTSQGITSKCIINLFSLLPKVENIIIDQNHKTWVTLSLFGGRSFNPLSKLIFKK